MSVAGVVTLKRRVQLNFNVNNSKKEKNDTVTLSCCQPVQGRPRGESENRC